MKYGIKELRTGEQYECGEGLLAHVKIRKHSVPSIPTGATITAVKFAWMLERRRIARGWPEDGAVQIFVHDPLTDDWHEAVPA